MKKPISVLLTVSIVLSVMTAGVGAANLESAYDGKLSPSAQRMDDIIGFTVTDDVVTYGVDADPGFFVEYKDGDLKSLEEWTNVTTRREILSYYNDSNFVLLRAPPADIFGGFVFDGLDTRLVSGLDDKRYVTAIDVNIRMDYVEPVSIENESVYQRPVPNGFVSGGWDSNGVAFSDDTNESKMGDVKDFIDVSGTYTGNGTRVAVIDSGANIADGQMFGNGTAGSSLRVVGAKNFISDEEVNVSANPPDWSIVEDRNGHGSWVAGAIAANVKNDTYDGIAPDADLLIAKALNSEGSGSTQDIIDAVRWAADNDADVISMSLGSPVYSPALASEMRRALNETQVSVIVVAVGNSRMNPTTRYIASPADVPVPGIVGVGATNPENASVAKSAYFSNVGNDSGARDFSNGVTLGQGPDVAAPGMNLTAPVLDTGGFRDNSTLSGTSMATPVVAGTILLMLEANPSLENDTVTVVGYLGNTTSPMPQAGVTEVGHGMVNAKNLTSLTPHETGQVASRNPDAIARDEANVQYSQSRRLRAIQRIYDRAR